MTLIAGGSIAGDGSIKNASGQCLGIKTCSGQVLAVTGINITNIILASGQTLPVLISGQVINANLSGTVMVSGELSVTGQIGAVVSGCIGIKNCSGTVLAVTGASVNINVYYLSGTAGPPGPPGPQGPIGFTGAIGPIGVTGVIGPIGFTGAVGPQGPIGFTGAIGPIGVTGAVGPQGPIGVTGLTGPQGPIGFTGAIGPIGFTGAIGPDGPIGATGAIGPIGVTGQIGPQGPQGFMTSGDLITIVSGMLLPTAGLTSGQIITLVSGMDILNSVQMSGNYLTSAEVCSGAWVNLYATSGSCALSGQWMSSGAIWGLSGVYAASGLWMSSGKIWQTSGWAQASGVYALSGSGGGGLTSSQVIIMISGAVSGIAHISQVSSMVMTRQISGVYMTSSQVNAMIPVDDQYYWATTGKPGGYNLRSLKNWSVFHYVSSPGLSLATWPSYGGTPDSDHQYLTAAGRPLPSTVVQSEMSIRHPNSCVASSYNNTIYWIGYIGLDDFTGGNSGATIGGGMARSVPNWVSGIRLSGATGYGMTSEGVYFAADATGNWYAVDAKTINGFAQVQSVGSVTALDKLCIVLTSGDSTFYLNDSLVATLTHVSGYSMTSSATTLKGFICAPYMGNNPNVNHDRAYTRNPMMIVGTPGA